MSSGDRLCRDATDGTHSQPSVQKLGLLLRLKSFLCFRCEGVPSEVSRLTLTLHGCGTRRCRDDQIEQADPHQELDHGSLLDEDVVCVDRLGDRFEAVHLTGDTDEVRGDEAKDSQHRRTAVTDLRLTEPWEEWFVRFRQLDCVVTRIKDNRRA
eukprot:CAMPEP_0113465200 /NCGR_PEP_ID=MMETSP0014_2-20120614/13613_1 /TAXON_ID=2857 /ORGANISM="Nitzschia sp." /LENGTH=153 /DNA_ID=CAMNT_0000357343 /DNA_START=176 /DNA_END=637 /DNA_ORIENTATION=- /assembly_acc=CAM_ASM_000159